MSGTSTPKVAFEFPPIHQYPPFYTRQLNEQVWQKQRHMWEDIILKYAQWSRCTYWSLEKGASIEVFHNAQIHRKVPHLFMETLLDGLIEQGYGEWDGKDKKACWLSWKTWNQWATLLHQYAMDHGLTHSICTLYELLQGEGTVKEEFHRIHERILLKAIQVLEKKGKALFIKGSSSDEMGVKFF